MKKFLLRIPDELFLQITDKAETENISIQAYIQNLIKNDLGIKTKTPVPLIYKLKKACISGLIQQPFTIQTFKQWIKDYNVINDQSGKPYTLSSIQSLLANSYLESDNKNNNSRVLNRRLNPQGVYEYWFDDEDTN